MAARIVCVLALLALFGTVPAQACSDADSDGVCDTLDNCPNDPNPDQANLDGDALGDVCDLNDDVLNVTRLELKHDAIGSPTDRSLYRVKGDFITSPPSNVVTAANGFSIRVDDALATDTSFTWTGADCQTSPKGNVRCINADATAKLLLTVLRAPGVYKLSAKVRRAGLPGGQPFLEPVDVTLTNGVIDRFGPISDCRVSNRGMLCREY